MAGWDGEYKDLMVQSIIFYILHTCAVNSCVFSLYMGLSSQFVLPHVSETQCEPLHGVSALILRYRFTIHLLRRDMSSQLSLRIYGIDSYIWEIGNQERCSYSFKCPLLSCWTPVTPHEIPLWCYRFMPEWISQLAHITVCAHPQLSCMSSVFNSG